MQVCTAPPMLPSCYQHNTKEKQESILALRRLKYAIKFSDLFNDECENFFCYVQIPKPMIPYVANTVISSQQQRQQHQQSSSSSPQNSSSPMMMNSPQNCVSLTPSQVQEIGVEFAYPDTFYLVSAFLNDGVLLFRAERDTFLKQRAHYFGSNCNNAQDDAHNNSNNNNNNIPVISRKEHIHPCFRHGGGGSSNNSHHSSLPSGIVYHNRGGGAGVAQPKH